MSKTSMFPISDLVLQFASFGFPNMKLATQKFWTSVCLRKQISKYVTTYPESRKIYQRNPAQKLSQQDLEWLGKLYE